MNQSMQSMLMKLEQTVSEFASEKSAEEAKQLQLQVLKKRLKDLQQYRQELTENCRHINNCDANYSHNELMTKKLEQLVRIHRLIGVSVSTVTEGVTRITFQMSYQGESCESYVTDVRLCEEVPIAIVRHDIPQFVPLAAIVARFSSGLAEFHLDDFVWSVYGYLNAYVTRKQDALAAKSSASVAAFVTGFSSSVAFDFIEISLKCSTPAVIQLIYTDLRQFLPSKFSIRETGRSTLFETNVLTSMENKLQTQCLSKSLPVVVDLLNTHGSETA